MAFHLLPVCLELFSREETLDSDNAWYCPRCKAHREATKKIQFWCLPEVLILHLKRFSAQGMWRRKNEAPVDFPFTIDMAPFQLSTDTNGSVYDLLAVSNHYGSTGGGHYTAFARDGAAADAKWHKYDDSHTAEVSADEVVTPAAYVLVYQRRGAAYVPPPEPPTVSATPTAELTGGENADPLAVD